MDGGEVGGGRRAKGTLNTQEEREREEKTLADQGRRKGGKNSFCLRRD